MSTTLTRFRLPGILVLLACTLAHGADRLVSRPRPAEPAVKALIVGDRITTAAGEQRRLLLPDRSLLFVRERTRLSIPAGNTVELSTGEVFIESAGGKPALIVRTPRRELRARDSRFGVQASATGTSVVVASGAVETEGTTVRGGQILSATAEKPAAAPRIAHLVAWTRDLRNAAPLVPASEHAGGSLIAREPDGQEAKLELRRYHIDVHIEDGFARTTIDQTFFNHTQERLEGTFRFPLPPDASLSRLAMYVEGKLMEGGMAERDHARAVYEQIVWEKRDPALLEWVDGSTFKMRIFPLEPRQEKRILLSYTQRLPVVHGALSYRFPAGHSLGQVQEWSFHARVKEGARLPWHCESHSLKEKRDKDDLLLQVTQKNARLDRDVVLTLTDRERPAVSFARATLDGAAYLMLRYRPEMVAPEQAQRRDWVILVESSGDRDPLLMRTQIEVIRSLLAFSGRDDTFVILTAGTRVRPLRDKAVRNDLLAIEEAMAGLEKVHLVGALDLGRALTEAAPFLAAGKTPYLVHVGSGIAAMGEGKTDRLVKRLPPGVRYVGVGVGRRWNRAFMQAAAEATSGLFTQVNPDEPVGWRGLEIATTLNTSRLVDVQVNDPDGKVRWLPFTRLVHQGEELAAITRIVGGDLPEKVRIRGRIDGKEFEREVKVTAPREGATYLPRSWARLEIDRLLAEDPVKQRKKIVELSKAMYVMTPFTSLLVLENDDMYAQFKVDRGRKDHWAMYPAPARIKVVYEPIEGDPGDPSKGIKPARRAVEQTVLMRTPAAVLGPREARGRRWVESSSEGAAPLTSAPVMLGDGDEMIPTSRARVRESMYERLARAGAISRADLFLRDMEEAKVPVRGTNLSFERLSQLALDHTPDSAAPEKAEVERIWYATDRLEAITDGTVNNLAGLSTLRAAQFAVDGRYLSAARGGDPRGGTIRLVGNLLHHRPGYSGDDRLFFDLLQYAPGLNTSQADLLAVVEAEARFDPRSRPGTIAVGARKLFDDARQPRWRTLSRDGVRIHFDGAGRYAWDRILPSGLREQVVSDGTTLWHAYPDLGLAARRSLSRFHRLAFAASVPWALPRIEDLARGADVVLVGDNTVAVVPQGTTDDKGKTRRHLQVHYVFKDGALVQRRLVEMPGKKLLQRETYQRDGQIEVDDADGKQRTTIAGKWQDGGEPSIRPDLKTLLVLDLPFRTPAHVQKALKIEKKGTAELTFREAQALLGAYVAAGDANTATTLFRDALVRREQRQLGYYVLLAACGANLDSDNLNVLDAHPHNPLAQYLALYSSPVLRKNASRWAAMSNAFTDTFLRRLALGHALCQRWATGKALGNNVAQRQSERDRALAYIRQHKGTPLAWALLGLMKERTAEEKDQKAHRSTWQELAKACELFADTPGLTQLARYEQAVCLWQAGQAEPARQLFRTLHSEALKAGSLLAIDANFRAALLDADKDGWTERIRATAAELIRRKERAAVLLLARQCWQLDDQPLALRLFAQAVEGVPTRGKEGLALHQAVIHALAEHGQHVQADQLLTRLLQDEEHARRPELWRLAAQLAANRERPGRRLECLEKALELDYANLPEVINLNQVREDYRSLLDEYGRLATAVKTLGVAIPVNFRDRVLRAADRWRALDRDQTDASERAAQVLRTLGERELVWDYLTTPVALRPGEADVWTHLANTLQRQGERDLADRAYAAAFDRESTNAEILWWRAENLRNAGRLVQAQSLYRQIADGDWQPRFRHLRTQARWMLEGH